LKGEVDVIQCFLSTQTSCAKAYTKRCAAQCKIKEKYTNMVYLIHAFYIYTFFRIKAAQPDTKREREKYTHILYS